MARIRTIKPEFPQSESMGRVSRNARLLFIMLWTICDDSGRTRGNSRMLASLLFPYDEDAPSEIDGWLEELEHEECLVRYSVDGSTYLQIRKWLNHQKIDKPSQSKIPPFDESSRIFSNPLERSSLDLGSKDLRIKDQGRDQGTDQDQKQAAEKCELAKQKKQTQAKPARFDPRSIDLPECVKPSAWEAWIDYRLARRLTCAEPTIKAQAKNLDEWWHEGHDPNAIIRASIANGWQGLFPPKSTAPPQPVDDGLEANRRLAEMAVKRLNLFGD